MLAIRKRNPVPLVLIVVFGSVTAFAWLMLLMRLTFGWVRFQVTIIPRQRCWPVRSSECCSRRQPPAVVLGRWINAPAAHGARLLRPLVFFGGRSGHPDAGPVHWWIRRFIWESRRRPFSVLCSTPIDLAAT